MCEGNVYCVEACDTVDLKKVQVALFSQVLQNIWSQRNPQFFWITYAMLSPQVSNFSFQKAAAWSCFFLYNLLTVGLVYFFWFRVQKWQVYKTFDAVMYAYFLGQSGMRNDEDAIENEEKLQKDPQEGVLSMDLKSFEEGRFGDAEKVQCLQTFWKEVHSMVLPSAIKPMEIMAESRVLEEGISYQEVLQECIKDMKALFTAFQDRGCVGCDELQKGQMCQEQPQEQKISSLKERGRENLGSGEREAILGGLVCPYCAISGVNSDSPTSGVASEGGGEYVESQELLVQEDKKALNDEAVWELEQRVLEEQQHVLSLEQEVTRKNALLQEQKRKNQDLEWCCSQAQATVTDWEVAYTGMELSFQRQRVYIEQMLRTIEMQKKQKHTLQEDVCFLTNRCQEIVQEVRGVATMREKEGVEEALCEVLGKLESMQLLCAQDAEVEGEVCF